MDFCSALGSAKPKHFLSKLSLKSPSQNNDYSINFPKVPSQAKNSATVVFARRKICEKTWGCDLDAWP